jgi:PAS domain S-box-containing protein
VTHHPRSAKSNFESLPQSSGDDHGEDTVIMQGGSRSLSSERPSPESDPKALQSLLDGMTDGLAAVDVTGKFVHFNPAAEAILGRGAVGGSPETWSKAYGLYLPDAKTPYPSEELPLIRALRGERTPEVEMYVRNERIPAGRWLRVRAAPTFDAAGRRTGAVAIFRDDTERRQAELALESERKFLRHLIHTQDRDRQLTAFDLHDGVVQLMTGALMRLEAYRGKPTEARQNDELQTAIDLVREAIEEARRMIGGLRPPAIDERGIVGAIEYLADPANRDDNLRVEFVHGVQFNRLNALQESTIFRIVQEALHNAARHSGSSRARVTLEQQGDVLSLEIRDWGKGFDSQTRSLRRFGLRGIEERSRLLGGTARIESAPDQGTAVRVTLPLKSDFSPDYFEAES